MAALERLNAEVGTLEAGPGRSAVVVPMLLAVGVVAWLVFVAIWPPRHAPAWWRDVTRPLRRRLRPRRYGNFY